MIVTNATQNNTLSSKTCFSRVIYVFYNVDLDFLIEFVLIEFNSVIVQLKDVYN